MKNIKIIDKNVKKFIFAYYKVRGGIKMTNINGSQCCNSCASNTPIMYNNNSGIGNYAFILVLFILLVICGTAFIF